MKRYHSQAVDMPRQCNHGNEAWVYSKGKMK